MNKQRTRWISALLAACLLFGAMGGMAAAVDHDEMNPLQAARFTDVPINQWFFNAVEYVATTGVMQGTSSNRFSPNMHFTRAQLVTTLFRIHNNRPANASDPVDNPFSDIPASEWYAPYVTWAYENGVVDPEGVGEGRFAPARNIDRQSFSTMLYRYAEQLTDRDTTVRQGAQWASFADRYSTAPWAVDALTWANYHGLITGRSATEIAPAGTAMRSEAATILVRLIEGPNFLPAPAVNARPFLFANFNAIRPQLGTLIESGSTEFAQYFLFDTGIYVEVVNGVVDYIFLIMTHGFGSPFHFSGLSSASTRAHVRQNVFGPPQEVHHEIIEGISFYEYTYHTPTAVLILTFANDYLIWLDYFDRTAFTFEEAASTLEDSDTGRTMPNRADLIALLDF